MLIPVKAVNSFSELLECYLGLLLVFLSLFRVVWSVLLRGGVFLFCHFCCGVVCSILCQVHGGWHDVTCAVLVLAVLQWKIF